MPWDEYINQDEFYWSASTERQEPIKVMPVDYALRALTKLTRQHGFAVLESPLGQALKQRTELGIGAEVVEFGTPHTGGTRMMLRDRQTKAFKAGAAKTRSKKKTV